MAPIPAARQPVRFAPPGPARTLIYWPAVAVATAVGALFVAAVTLFAAHRPARMAEPDRVAQAEPPRVDLTVPSLPPGPPAVAAPPASAPAETRNDEASHSDPPALGLPPLDDTPPPLDVTPPADAGPITQAPTAPASLLAPAAPVCQTFGTSVQFASSPAAAAKQAAQDGKLLFLLHVSGDFEDDAFT